MEGEIAPVVAFIGRPGGLDVKIPPETAEDQTVQKYDQCVTLIITYIKLIHVLIFCFYGRVSFFFLMQLLGNI